MALKSSDIYVIGHKNPDTDSICSAICYANLKNRNGNTTRYIPMRSGEINEETRYVLQRFGVKAPEFIDDISTTLGDIEINGIEGVDESISMQEAWMIMREKRTQTLPVIDGERKLIGLITNEDIARSYMETVDSSWISAANTNIGKIAQTVGGKILAGSGEGFFDHGKVLIAAADIDYMKAHIESGDLVILGNRESLQLEAIRAGAKIIIACTIADVSEAVIEEAKKSDAVVICVEKDTYTVAQLVGQSMPISHFMTKENIVSFGVREWTDTVRDTMSKMRFKYFPVLDKKGRYVGLVSRRNIIADDKRKIVLVDHNEKEQAVDGISSGEIIEIIDHHKIGAMQTMAPITFRNQPLGCTATIIYEMYEEERVAIPQQIAGLLLSAILSDTLMFRSPTCTLKDQKAAERLARIADVDITELAMSMFKAGSNFANKEMRDIFFQDFKKFTTGEFEYGVGQVNILTVEDAEALKVRVKEYLKEEFKMRDLNMVFFILTNIMEESSDIIFAGSKADDLVREAFGKIPEDNCVTVPGLVSRKKQFLPPMMAAMQN